MKKIPEGPPTQTSAKGHYTRAGSNLSFASRRCGRRAPERAAYMEKGQGSGFGLMGCLSISSSGASGAATVDQTDIRGSGPHDW